MYGWDFSSQSSFPGKKLKNEKALNLSTDFFNFCYLHGKIKPYVVLTRRSMDLDAVTHFSDSLLVMFSVTSRRDRPKRRPSRSIFLVHSTFRESLHEGRPYDKISESCDKRVNGKRPPAVLQHRLVYVKFVFKFRPDDAFHVEILQNPAGNLID